MTLTYRGIGIEPDELLDNLIDRDCQLEMSERRASALETDLVACRRGREIFESMHDLGVDEIRRQRKIIEELRKEVAVLRSEKGD
jgi:hypothetical protein